jgi:hypothetical protein
MTKSPELERTKEIKTNSKKLNNLKNNNKEELVTKLT